ncbi:MAG: GNAT family N-acetyltransferase [Micromonosporaceae bacterium]
MIDVDLPAYATQVLPWLLRDPVVNNVACSLIEQRLDGAVPTEADALWLRVLDTGDGTAGIALQTPPWGLLMSGMPDPAAEAVAESLAERHPALATVNGPNEASGMFAARYAELTGTVAGRGMAQRMYRLDTVTAPNGVPGRLRAVTDGERDLLVEWSTGFLSDAMPHAVHSAAATVDSRLAQGGLLWFWEVGGRPVSMAWLNHPAAGVARISGVYTPPELRGRGYASGSVATLSQYVLDHGGKACMLYTDLANPTSNAIYQRLGYRPVADVQEWRFTSQPAVGEAR